MTMVHGDDKGLILPPRVAPIQVVIVPILKKGSEKEIDEAVAKIERVFEGSEVRLHVDRRDHVSAGFKYNDWELKARSKMKFSKTKGSPVKNRCGQQRSQTRHLFSDYALWPTKTLCVVGSVARCD